MFFCCDFLDQGEVVLQVCLAPTGGRMPGLSGLRLRLPCVFPPSFINPSGGVECVAVFHFGQCGIGCELGQHERQVRTIPGRASPRLEGSTLADFFRIHLPELFKLAGILRIDQLGRILRRDFRFVGIFFFGIFFFRFIVYSFMFIV